MDQPRFLKHFLPAERALRAFFRAATRNVHETDDLLQQVSYVLWEKFPQYDESRPFVAWAMGFARLQVLRWRQSVARSPLVLPDEAIDALADAATAGSVAEADARAEFLEDCLRGLGDSQREAMRLRYEDDLPVAAVAGAMGKKADAVEMLMVRARRALRECVEMKLRQSGHARGVL